MRARDHAAVIRRYSKNTSRGAASTEGGVGASASKKQQQEEFINKTGMVNGGHNSAKEEVDSQQNHQEEEDNSAQTTALTSEMARQTPNDVGNVAIAPITTDRKELESLMVEPGDSHVNGENGKSLTTASPSSSAGESVLDSFASKYCKTNPEFFAQAAKFVMCFCGLQLSYLTWGYMQELIMTTEFVPTTHAPDGKFPSAAFCVFSNRFLAVLVALFAVRVKHGAFFDNNTAPLIAFTPCALSNTMSSWSQYASLKFVSFPVQTVFKSSKIIPVMIMGKVLKGTSYPWGQYIEALLITVGVAVFSVLSKESTSDNSTEVKGLIFLLTYICSDCFTSQWQDKVYTQYGRANVDPYQMMLGVNVSAICITISGLVVSGDFPVVYEFLMANPNALNYNIVTAITSATGQLFIFYTIKEFGPIVFTIIMTTRQMFSICLSAIIFGHVIKLKAALGAVLVFGVLFWQIRRKYYARMQKQATAPAQK